MENGKQLTAMGETIGWRTVRNSVTERLSDHSLIHNLAPCRRLRRRTKALNVTLRRFSGIKSYSQYVKIRTTVLRNISDDSNIDDSGSFSEEDYAILHKSNLTERERNNTELESEIDFVCQQKPDMDTSSPKEYEPIRQKTTQKKTERVRQRAIQRKCSTAKKRTTRKKSETAKIEKASKKSEIGNKETAKKKSLPKKPSISNVGWQNVVKRRIEGRSYTQINNSGKEGAGRIATDLPEDLWPQTTKTIVTCKSNRETSEVFPKREGSENLEKSLPGLNGTSTENQNPDDEKPLTIKLPLSVDKIKKENKEIIKDNKEKCSSSKKQRSNSSRNEDSKVEGVKKNLAKIFAEQLENEHEPLNSLNKNENNLEKGCTEKEESPVSPVKVSTPDSSSPLWRSESEKPEIIQGTNHPKDSGIDEDSQEELSEDGKHSENKADLLKNVKNSENTADKRTIEVANDCTPILTTDVTDNQDQLSQQKTLPDSCSESQAEESKKLSQIIDSSEPRNEPQEAAIENEQEDTSVLNLSNISILEEMKEEAQKPKLHPKVMHTEVVNQKIKIIPVKYQNNINPMKICGERNKSNDHQTCQKSDDEEIEDMESVSGNETIDRNFTLQLDSSDMQNEESAPGEMQEVFGESTIIDKNLILANSTEIQKQDGTHSENESENSEDTSRLNKINAARADKKEKGRDSESGVVAKKSTRANSTEIQNQDGANSENEFQKSKKLNTTLSDETRRERFGASSIIAKNFILANSTEIKNQDEADSENEFQKSKKINTARPVKKKLKRINESVIAAKNVILPNSTEIEKQGGTNSEDEFEKSEDAFHINKMDSMRARKKEKERNGRLKQSIEAKNAVAVVDAGETMESDSGSKDSTDIEFTTVKMKKKESYSVKDVTQDSTEFGKRMSTEDFPSQESVAIQDEEISDSSAKPKPRSPSKALIAHHQKDILEIEDSVVAEESDGSAEDSMSALSKKRLQQLKRLNLTVESESSSSEDERAIESIRHPRNKFKKERKSPTSSLNASTENTTKSKGRRATTPDSPVNPYLSDSDEHDNETSSIESFSKKIEKMSDRLSNSTNNNVDSEKKTAENTGIVKSSKKNKKGDHPLGNWAISKIAETSFPSALSTSTPKAVKQKRPENLQELIEEQGLVEEVIDAGISYKDLGEDDVYLLEVPRAALEADLIGEKIVLNEKKLKLGKQKYKVSHKTVEAISFCFATGKSRKPYKIANLKPVAAILAQAKLSVSVTSTNTVHKKSEVLSTVNDQSVMKVSSQKRRRKSQDNSIPEDDAARKKTKRFKFRSNDDNGT